MRQLRKASRTIPSSETIPAIGGAAAVETAAARDQCMRRVKPQTGQVATLVSGSTTRKLVQPFVLQ